jgi:hypothetical protein
MSLQQFGQVIAQDGAGSGQSKPLAGFTAQARARFKHPAEEWIDKLKELATGGGKRERTSLKELETQMVFKLQNLSADGGLLDTIGHLSHRFTDATVPGYLMKKFQMMDIHKCYPR